MRLNFTNGYYEGDVVCGKPHGSGMLRLNDGTQYTGAFFQGVFHGYGFLVMNGSKYDGEFKNGKRHGHGHWVQSNGDLYDGNMVEDKYSGYGKYVGANNSFCYEGNWSNNQMSGQGKLRYTDGAVYEGEFFCGKRCGNGICTYSNGAVYDGEWRDDQWNGHGVYTLSNGIKCEEEWENGESDCDEYHVTFPDGRYFEGSIDLATGEVYDYGTMEYPEGDLRKQYNGDFVNSLPDGKGAMFYKDGSFYDGEWRKGKRDGNGTMTCAGTHDIYSGEWYNDMPDGEGQYVATSWTFTGDFRKGLNARGVYTDIAGKDHNGRLVDGKFVPDED